MRLVLDPTIRIFKLLNTAAVTTMVVQPNAALGNAPKNPRYILYYVCTIWAKFRWSKKRINIISDQFPLLSTPCHYDKMPTPNSNYFYRMPEQKPSKRLFLSQAASFTHRSYLRLSFPHLLTVKKRWFLMRNSLSPPRGFVQTSPKNSWVCRYNYCSLQLINTMSRKKSLFLIFLKQWLRRQFHSWSVIILKYKRFAQGCCWISSYLRQS